MCTSTKYELTRDGDGDVDGTGESFLGCPKKSSATLTLTSIIVVIVHVLPLIY